MLLSIALEDAGSQQWDTGCDAKWFSQKSVAFGPLFHFYDFFFYVLFTAVLDLHCACEGLL